MKNKSKLMSMVLLFAMLFQISFLSNSFALEAKNSINYNYEYREYTFDDLSEMNLCDDMSKEEIIAFLDLLNDPEVRKINNELMKQITDSDRISRMHWYQTPLFVKGMVLGVYDELESTVDGLISLLKPSTYKSMAKFCMAIASGEIGLGELQDLIWSDFECVEYVIDNTIDVFGSDPYDEQVEEYGKNLAKTIIKILDAKSMLKELPESFSKFSGFLDDFGGITGNAIKNKKPDLDLIDLDKVEDVVDETDFLDDINLNKYRILSSTDDIIDYPESLSNMDVEEIADLFRNEGFDPIVEQSTKGSGLAMIIRINRHKINMIQVHPGGGRHGLPYIKVKGNGVNFKVVKGSPSDYIGNPNNEKGDFYWIED